MLDEMIQKRLPPTARGLKLAVGPDRGPPLLMLHGVTRNRRTFLPLLPAITARRQVSALDFPGHGESKPARDGYRAVDYAEDAATALRSLGRTKVVLFGHSLGATVGALIAANQADRPLP